MINAKEATSGQFESWTREQLLAFLGYLIYQKGGEIMIPLGEFDRVLSIIDQMHLEGTQNKDTGAIRVTLKEK